MEKNDNKRFEGSFKNNLRKGKGVLKIKELNFIITYEMNKINNY